MIMTKSKSELAWQYSPALTQTAALNRLNRWIKGDPTFHDALRAAGYRDNQRILTPRQVELFYEYLGTPEEYREYSSR